MPPARQLDKPEDHELSPELWDAWQVFSACQNQWRISVGFAALRYEGIEFTSLEIAMGIYGIRRKKRRDVLWMVQVMEDEAKKFLNKP